MMLMTKEIERKIPALYSTEDIPAEDKEIAVKFFCPWSNWTWYAVEGEKEEDGDWLFFGLVEGFEKEWGYWKLSDLTEIKGPFGLKIERDRHFTGAIREAA